MAWLRILMLLLIGGIASAHPQPPRDFDDPLHERESYGRMRPPPVDPNEIYARSLTMALERATTDVRACVRRLRLEQLDVRVAVGDDEPTIELPRLQSRTAPRCVKRAIAEAIRGTFGPGFKRRPKIETTFRYTLRPRRTDVGFSQPPP